MSFKDALRRSIVEGFDNIDMPTSEIAVTLFIAFFAGMYIFGIYRFVNRTSLYDRGFHVTLAMISVVTAGIIVAMQSSIVISMGMVGALSIVRFRTAIKDPLDLLFLFWSIGVGIICGAGLYKVALIMSLIVTGGLFFLEWVPQCRKPYVLVVNAEDADSEIKVMEVLKREAGSVRIKSRNLKKSGLDMVIELRTKREREMLGELAKTPGVLNVSLLDQEGEIRL